MNFSMSPEGRELEIINMFRDTFTASEGKDEGDLIGALVQQQLAETPSGDIYVFIAEDGSELLGACVFTRMTFDHSKKTVFVLAPVAVATTKQGKGVGQALLRYALQVAREENVEIVMTYGDPDYYGKVGFRFVSEDDIAAPFKLQYPHGWLGLSLTELPLSPLKGNSHCVSALNKSVFW